MKFEKLQKHEHYYYTHTDFFNTSLDLVHAFLMKDYDIGMHEQEFYEINVVTRGRGTHYIGDSRVDATVGDVFIVPPHIEHGYVGGEGFDVFHVIVSDGFMNKYIADLQQMAFFYTLFGAEPVMRGKTAKSLHLTLLEEEFERVIGVLREIARYVNYEDPIECMIRSNYTMVAIGFLCGAYTLISNYAEDHSFEDKALMDSISFMHERYFEKITIDDLLRIAHLSRSSYIKKFKEICNMTPAAYLNKIRIESAASMLHNTAFSISDIAERTGFYDSSHFTKAFTAFYGISPVAYRNR